MYKCMYCVHVLCVFTSALLAKLQGVVLSDLSERLNTLVSVLVRVKKCESEVSSVVALEDLVGLLSKMKRCVVIAVAS